MISTVVDLANVFQFKVDAGDGAVGNGATVYWDNIYFTMEARSSQAQQFIATPNLLLLDGKLVLYLKTKV